MEGYMCIREYAALENLVEKDFGPAFMQIKAFPLFPELKRMNIRFGMVKTSLRSMVMPSTKPWRLISNFVG